MTRQQRQKPDPRPLTPEKKKAYGYGPYADEPYSYSAIERCLAAIGWFYDQLLLDMDQDDILNPAKHRRVIRAKGTLAKLMGVGRVHETPALLREHVISMLREVDLDNTEEVAIAQYMSGNLINGVRARAQYFVDWEDVNYKPGTANERAGLEITYLADKDDREQVGRVKAVPCSSVCQKGIERGPDGKLKTATFCPCHFTLHLKSLQARDDALRRQIV